jgi:hypothetical protein
LREEVAGTDPTPRLALSRQALPEPLPEQQQEPPLLTAAHFGQLLRGQGVQLAVGHLVDDLLQSVPGILPAPGTCDGGGGRWKRRRGDDAKQLASLRKRTPTTVPDGGLEEKGSLVFRWKEPREGRQAGCGVVKATTLRKRQDADQRRRNESEPGDRGTSDLARPELQRTDPRCHHQAAPIAGKGLRSTEEVSLAVLHLAEDPSLLR